MKGLIELRNEEKTVQLETDRLVLYPFSDSEMIETIAREKDPELKQAYGEMYALSTEHPRERNWYIAWKIVNKENGKTVGDLCFKGPPLGGAVEIGYGIYEDEQNKGYCTESVSKMVEWAFSQKDVLVVEAETEPTNYASQKVLSKLGFSYIREGLEGPRFALHKNKEI